MFAISAWTRSGFAHAHNLTSATLVRKSARAVDGVEDMAEVFWDGAAVRAR